MPVPGRGQAEEGLRATGEQVDRVLAAVTAFVGDYGWHILAGCLLVLWARGAAGPWLAERANQRAIRDAQRRERVEVLDPDMRRVRQRQQEEALQKAAAAAAGATSTKQGKAM